MDMENSDIDLEVKFMHAGMDEITYIEERMMAIRCCLIAKIRDRTRYKCTKMLLEGPVPLLCLTVDGQQFDIVINRSDGVKNSRVLATVIEMIPDLPVFLFCLKQWSKQNDFVEYNYNDIKQHVSSYALNLMALAYLQTKGMVPLLERNGEWAPFEVKGGFYILDELAVFMRYYEQFDFEEKIISLHHIDGLYRTDMLSPSNIRRQLRRRETFNELENLLFEQFSYPVLCLQDPWKYDRNVLISVSKAYKLEEKFIEAVKTASRVLTASTAPFIANRAYIKSDPKRSLTRIIHTLIAKEKKIYYCLGDNYLKPSDTQLVRELDSPDPN